ncbi:MAG: radical SAM protein [Candidatus Muiribacteriota bacterium]
MKEIDLTLEISNTCNFKCDMCYLEKKDNVSKSFMNIETVQEFANQIENSSYKIKVLRIFWAGEPLMNPDFDNIIKILSKMDKVERIAFDTNASLLDSQKISTLIELASVKPVHIIFSLDGYSDEIYRNIRKGGNFFEVMKNIETFIIKYSNSIHSQNIKTMVQFVVHPLNCHELKDFINHWRNFYQNNNLDFNIFLNQSMALDNGVNIRPLTVQSDEMGISQQNANILYEKTLKESGIINHNQKILNFSQGGGKIEIQ